MVVLLGVASLWLHVRIAFCVIRGRWWPAVSALSNGRSWLLLADHPTKALALLLLGCPSGHVAVQRVAAAVRRKIKIYLLRVGHERDGGERNDRNGERKDREIPRGRKNGGRAWWSREAARARNQKRNTLNEAAGTASPRGMDPESFTYEEKESYVRFAPFMGMRSWTLEPRSEMQGGASRRALRVGREYVALLAGAVPTSNCHFTATRPSALSMAKAEKHRRRGGCDSSRG